MRRLIRQLCADLPAAIVIAQHVQQITLLPEILANDTTMNISLAWSGVLLRSSHLYVCPAANHVIVNPDATLTVSSRDRLRYFRPSGDWLFESAAASFGDRVFAIVLSGLQNDGVHGIGAVRKAGGTVVAQDPRTCERAEMPSAAIAASCVDHVLAPDGISNLLNTELAKMDVARYEALRDDPFGEAERILGAMKSSPAILPT